MRLGEHILRALCALEPTDKLVHVKSWRPCLIDGELLWPVMLIDRNGYRRETVCPVWDRTRLTNLFRRDAA